MAVTPPDPSDLREALEEICRTRAAGALDSAADNGRRCSYFSSLHSSRCARRSASQRLVCARSARLEVRLATQDLGVAAGSCHSRTAPFVYRSPSVATALQHK